MSDLLVEGAPDTGGDGDAKELSQAAEWFTEQGFPVPPELTLAPGAVQGEPEAAAPEPETPEPPLDEPEASPQAKGWETRRQGLKKAYETVQSEYQTLQNENRQERAYNEALLQVVKELHAKAKTQGAPEAPPEEEADIIDAPDTYVQSRIDKALEPYKKAIGLLLNKNNQSEESVRVDQMVSTITNSRVAYENENPGFVARASEYRDAFVDDLQETGMSPEEANEAFTRQINGLMFEAMRRGNNPIVAIDRIASRYATYGPSQPAQNGYTAPAPAPQNVRAAAGDRIAAAMRASQGGATRPGPSIGNAGDSDDGPVTMQDIRNGRVRPQDVKKLLSQPGGTEKFWQLAKAIEEEG